MKNIFFAIASLSIVGQALTMDKVQSYSESDSYTKHETLKNFAREFLTDVNFSTAFCKKFSKVIKEGNALASLLPKLKTIVKILDLGGPKAEERHAFQTKFDAIEDLLQKKLTDASQIAEFARSKPEARQDIALTYHILSTPQILVDIASIAGVLREIVCAAYEHFNMHGRNDIAYPGLAEGKKHFSFPLEKFNEEEKQLYWANFLASLQKLVSKRKEIHALFSEDYTLVDHGKAMPTILEGTFKYSSKLIRRCLLVVPDACKFILTSSLISPETKEFFLKGFKEKKTSLIQVIARQPSLHGFLRGFEKEPPALPKAFAYVPYFSCKEESWKIFSDKLYATIDQVYIKGNAPITIYTKDGGIIQKNFEEIQVLLASLSPEAKGTMQIAQACSLIPFLGELTLEHFNKKNLPQFSLGDMGDVQIGLKHAISTMNPLAQVVDHPVEKPVPDQDKPLQEQDDALIPSQDSASIEARKANKQEKKKGRQAALSTLDTSPDMQGFPFEESKCQSPIKTPSMQKNPIHLFDTVLKCEESARKEQEAKPNIAEFVTLITDTVKKFPKEIRSLYPVSNKQPKLVLKGKNIFKNLEKFMRAEKSSFAEFKELINALGCKIIFPAGSHAKILDAEGATIMQILKPHGNDPSYRQSLLNLAKFTFAVIFLDCEALEALR